MKRILLSIIFAGLALTSAQAACNNYNVQECHNWYAQANGSFGWHNDSKFRFDGDSLHERQKTGFGGSIAVGRIIDQWRLELEASYRESSSKSKLYTSNTSLMANLYYDIPVLDDISIYVGAGAGISSVNGKVHRVELNNTSVEFAKDRRNLDTVFAWQFMTGVSYALCENWDLIAGYRLFGTAKPTIAKAHGEKLKMTNTPIVNSVELGLRFKF